ncbi:hypothetical protein RclHR1_12390006 [Rhizophagus clarus]|uniref:Uncharacterized protein n=1 Tax=Rhizophagus clarus TaxID=94130 RepID=A0A2Z6QM36_9GLOM|nr:hypothetical protein RclHR1_12390006 [Rhizophagus clarus]
MHVNLFRSNLNFFLRSIIFAVCDIFRYSHIKQYSKAATVDFPLPLLPTKATDCPDSSFKFNLSRILTSGLSGYEKFTSLNMIEPCNLSGQIPILSGITGRLIIF